MWRLKVTLCVVSEVTQTHYKKDSLGIVVTKLQTLFIVILIPADGAGILGRVTLDLV